MSGTLAAKTAVVAVAALFALMFVALPVTHAQSKTSGPTLLVTWHANNSYVPFWYSGKALPNILSRITASVELISAQGQIVSLANQPVYWYFNGNLLSGGVGMQRITFSPYGAVPNIFTLTVNLLNYNGGMEQDINIPLMQPVAVIEAPYPANTFSSSPATVTALPFYFNVSGAASLVFSWSVNGVNGTNGENPDIAQVSLPAGTAAGTKLAVQLGIQNADGTTAASASRNLTYQP